MKKKTPLLMLFAAIALLLTLGQPAWAFSDVKSDPNREPIEALREAGILNGMKDGAFLPGGQLTYAAGVSIIVKGLALDIDGVRFVKEPKASDSFPNLKDDAWYSEAFVIASLNGLDIPADVKADAPLTREQFAHYLYQAVASKGDFATIEMYIMLDDEADVTPAYMGSIQKLLLMKIASLDDEQRFRPQETITRGEAAGWLHRAIKFVKETPPVPEEPAGGQLFDYKLDVADVNEQVKQVTVSAQAPHPGYGLRIASIVFDGSRAIIHTEVVQPDPDRMYPQVITEVEAVAYVGAEFEPELADAPVAQDLPGSIGDGDMAVSDQP